MGQHETVVIKRKWWHKAYNKSDTPCHILEVQYGDKCIEEDIERASSPTYDWRSKRDGITK